MIIVGASASLYVYHPTKLRNEIDQYTGEIKSSLANFGLVHYGHSIIGRVWFDDKNSDGCKDFDFEVDGTGDPDADPSPIVMVMRGNCPFTQKVRNVEHAGGRLAIVVDDKDNENPENIIMVDDGSGNGIRIPAILIGKTDGRKVLKYMEDDKGTHTDIHVALMASFDIVHPDNRVEWDFWYSSSNEKALEFLRGYRENQHKLGDKTLFTPHFSFWSCVECDNKLKRDMCFGDGKYCAIDTKNSKLTGQEILEEDLRQKCLYKKLTMNKYKKEDLFWDYIEIVLTNCYNGINEDCSKQAHTELELDFKVTQACVNKSFSNNKDRSNSKNSLFDEEIEYEKNYGPHFFPAAVINNVTYRGILEPENFFSAICEGFKDKPKECKSSTSSTTIIEGINTFTLLMIIFALVIINIGIIICYKRYAKKEMDDKIDMHINSAVSQYFALQDKSSTTKTTRPLVH